MCARWVNLTVREKMYLIECAVTNGTVCLCTAFPQNMCWGFLSAINVHKNVKATEE
jgi:hypothetical protein